MKKGVSPIIATVILLTITVLLGAIIFKFSMGAVTSLSPPADCSDVNFNIQIVDNILEVDNIGNENIVGLRISIDNKKGLIEVKEIAMMVAKGDSAQKKIEFNKEVGSNSEIKAQAQIIRNGGLSTCEVEQLVD